MWTFHFHGNRNSLHSSTNKKITIIKRSLGIGNDGLLAQFDDVNAVIPFNGSGNNFALESIYKGADVDTTHI